MRGTCDGEFEETGERKMKNHTNDMFFLDCGRIKENQNLSLLFALLSKRVNLQSEGDIHIYMYLISSTLQQVAIKLSSVSFWKYARNDFWQIISWI